MDTKLKRLGFAVKLPSLGGFETLSSAGAGAEYHTDTTLRLESPGSSSLYSSNLTGTKRKWTDNGRKETLDYASLALGLGCSQSSSDSSRRSSATICMSSAKEADESSSMDLALNFQLHLGNESTSIPRGSTATTSKACNDGCIHGLQLTLSLGASESVISNVTPVPVQHQSTFERSVMIGPELIIDEGSIASCPRSGQQLLPYLCYSEGASEFPPNQKIPSMRKCQFQGCGKGARGASGLCIAHGGGRRCHKDGCQKGAEGRTIYCKAHGGGRRCEHLGCTKSAEGRTDYCIAHGGGRRCSHVGCTRAARGKSGLCIKHGGGKRCKKENCTKSAEGHTGVCISHGGGRRCQHPECSKGAQGSTMFCKAHGGGKRCTFSGCNKGAEGSTPFCKGHGGGKRCSFQGGCGKSVHGGTQFCVAHGGGKRCAAPDCTKSARGRTDFCVRHGGGKRCKFDGCGKSAQGSTDFCKAHGGGKRCLWGQQGSDLAAGSHPCNRFARGKTGLCAAHSALVQDQCVHGGALLDPVVTQHKTTSKLEKMKGIAFDEDIFLNIGNGREKQVSWDRFNQKKFMHHVMPLQSSLLSLPEGRVHGGNLLALLASSGSLGNHPGDQAEGGTSEQGIPYKMVHDWV